MILCWRYCGACCGSRGWWPRGSRSGDGWYHFAEMANQKDLDILEKGIEAWNAWRKECPLLTPDLNGASLNGLALDGANFRRAQMVRADLSNAYLANGDFAEADLSNSRLNGANLPNACLASTNLTDA